MNRLLWNKKALRGTQLERGITHRESAFMNQKNIYECTAWYLHKNGFACCLENAYKTLKNRKKSLIDLDGKVFYNGNDVRRGSIDYIRQKSVGWRV